MSDIALWLWNILILIFTNQYKRNQIITNILNQNLEFNCNYIIGYTTIISNNMKYNRKPDDLSWVYGQIIW